MQINAYVSSIDAGFRLPECSQVVINHVFRGVRILRMTGIANQRSSQSWMQDTFLGSEIDFCRSTTSHVCIDSFLKEAVETLCDRQSVKDATNSKTIQKDSFKQKHLHEMINMIVLRQHHRRIRFLACKQRAVSHL